MINHFRVARHTDKLEEIKFFYIELIGLKLMGEFDHQGYQGAFIGEKNQTWHLEYTQSKEKPIHISDDDDLLVFYLGDNETYYECIKRIEKSGLKSVTAKNLYWDQWGKTFLDPDGFRVVISHREWTNE